MRQPLLLLCALLAATAAGGAEIHVTSDPPLPAANLVRNPGAEAGQAGAPSDWRFTTAIPENFETGWVDGGRSGKCLWLRAKSARMSGYWNQPVPVEAGKSYLFKGHFRIAGGKVLCYAHSSVALPDGRRASVDERFYQGTMRGHWLVPVFLPADSLGGPDPERWYPFRLKVKVPAGMQAVALSLGMFFTAGEAWYDDLWAGPAETELAVSVKAAPGETLRRVTVTPVGTEKPLFDSQALAEGTAGFERKVPGVPTDGVYEIAVTLGDGKVVKALYPSAGEK